MKINTRYPFYCVVMAFALLLSSCDGGLFGTGDGHNNDVMIDGTGGGDTGSDVTGNPDTTTGGSDGTTGEGADQSTAAFDNLLSSSQISAPQLRIINLTDNEILIAANTVGTDAIGLVRADDDSGRISLPVDVSSLFFSITTPSALDPELVQTIDRFNAAEFSITTVIVRIASETQLEVIPLVTRASATSNDTALVRLVQANELGDATRSATLSLIAVEPANSGSDVSFVDLSFVSIATDYRDVLPGSYTLSDFDNRFSDESISFAAGKVYTVIINNDIAPVLRVIVDSD